MGSENTAYWTFLSLIVCFNSICSFQDHLAFLCDDQGGMSCADNKQIVIMRLTYRELCRETDRNCNPDDRELSSQKVREACNNRDPCHIVNITEMIDPSVCDGTVRKPEINIHFQCVGTRSEDTTVADTTPAVATTPQATTTSSTSTSTKTTAMTRGSTEDLDPNQPCSQIVPNCDDSETKCFKEGNLTEFPTKQIPENVLIVQLSNNNIAALGRKSLTGLTRLQMLILSNNNIMTIVPGVFRNQTDLKRLDLGDNSLTTINGTLWVGLSSLETLRITGNKLHNIPPRSFSNLPKLKVLAVGFTLLKREKQKLFEANTFPSSKTQPKIGLEQDNNTLVCNSSNCWLKEKEDQGLLVHYEKNGWPSRPKCSDQPGLYWDQAGLKCADNRILIASIVGGVVGSLIIFVSCIAFIRCMCNRRKPKNEDNPVYQGVGPRPPRGMPPPIIIHDMRALEQRREENLRAARERLREREWVRERERFQVEPRHEENLQPQRQPAHDHNQQPSVEVAVLPGACGYGAGCGQSNDQPDKGNAAAQCMPEQKMKNQLGKVAVLRSRFEVPQEMQVHNKKRRQGVSAGPSAPEGIYSEINEVEMMDFNPQRQQKGKIIKRTVVNV